VFGSAAQQLFFEETHPKVVRGEIFTVQEISGKGVFEFISMDLPAEGLVSNPTRSNLIKIVEESRLKVKEYPYFDFGTKRLDFIGMIDALGKPPLVEWYSFCMHGLIIQLKEQCKGVLKVILFKIKK
jgi:aspartate/tyrosine/aromatic aminotransferase